MKKLLLALFLISSQIVLSQKLEPLIPDRSLVSFLEEFKQAVSKKDKTWIINNLHPNVMNSFGNDGGIEEFKKSWEFQGDASAFWKLMDKIIDLGGGTMKSEDMYSMPYVFSHWPDEYDAFENVAITGTNVNIRDKPAVEGSEVVGQFSYDIVSIDFSKSVADEGDDKVGYYSWCYVESQDKTLKGYVYGDFVWSPLTYRIGFEKKNKKWKITYLLAGD